MKALNARNLPYTRDPLSQCVMLLRHMMEALLGHCESGFEVFAHNSSIHVPQYIDLKGHDVETPLH